MVEKLLIASLICISALGADRVGSIVAAADGNQYRLVKAEKKLSNGAIEIAEYVLVGDNSGVRYARHLALIEGKHTFWKISSIHAEEVLFSFIELRKKLYDPSTQV
jgi:hypothetical protein